MTKSDFSRSIICIICIIMAALSFTFCADAANDSDEKNDGAQYRVVIIDSLDLLTDDEERKLTEDMTPLTAYGNVAFWTTDEAAFDEIDQARVKRKELFGYESGSIFVINMEIRKLTIQSYGTIKESITDSVARSITDNVSKYATKGKYYTCSRTAFSQMYAVCERGNIPEPLKKSGYVVISFMLGLIIAISIAFSKKHNPLLESCLPEDEMPYQAEGRFISPVTYTYAGSKTDYRPPASSSSDSGSSCSSCSSGSSCSSCSSGGCGSGGSSSF